MMQNDRLVEGALSQGDIDCAIKVAEAARRTLKESDFAFDNAL